MKYPILVFEQPAGKFLLTSMPVMDIIKISKADPRKFDDISMETVGGIQREPSRKRILEIADYAGTVDATFPTAILLALGEGTYIASENEIEILGEAVADIVDGQHRVLGLKEFGRNQDFEIPVVFILEPTEEQKALIFATINGKQTKVPASLIYDLFGVTETRSPQKTAHEIARAMNASPDSPWYRRLKMLGKKTEGSTESLSQGTFVKYLLQHISSDPVADRDLLKQGKEAPSRKGCIFNDYFRSNDDTAIFKILLNVFNAARETWSNEWENPSVSILTKTTGFSAIMRALPRLIEKGRATRDLSKDFFVAVFKHTRGYLESKGLKLVSSDFSPSAANEQRLANIILSFDETKTE